MREEFQDEWRYQDVIICFCFVFWPKHAHEHPSSGAVLRMGSAQSWLLPDRLFLTLFFTDLSVVLYAVQLSDPRLFVIG